MDSDHLPLLITIRTSLPSSTGENTFTKTTTNLDKVYATAAQTCFSHENIRTIQDIDSRINHLTTSIQDAINQATTTKEIRTNSEHLLTLPQHIVKTIKARRKAKRKFKQSRNKQDRSEYNRLTATVKLEIAKNKQAKWIAFCETLNGFPPSTGEAFKKIKAIEGGQTSAKQTCLINNHGLPTKDPGEISDIFANHLEKVFTEEDDPTFFTMNHRKVNNEAPFFFTQNVAEPEETNAN